MKRIYFTLLVAVVLGFNLCPQALAIRYSDVPEISWYSECVEKLSDAGVIGGFEDGTFRPDDSVTYGQALKLIMLSTGYEEQPPVNGGSWASGYFDRALLDKLITTVDFTLDEPIDRSSFTTIAAKALKLEPVTNTGSSYFADSRDPYVLAMNQAGIIFGTIQGGANYFQGSHEITRAETSVTLFRILNYYEQNVSAPAGDNIPARPDTSVPESSEQSPAPSEPQALAISGVSSSKSLFNISACADWRDRFFALQGKKPQKS